MNNLSKLWHRLGDRSDRDIHFIERVVEIEDLVHDLGVWHLLTLNSPSTSMLESKVLVINNNLKHLIWEYNDLLANDKRGSEDAWIVDVGEIMGKMEDAGIQCDARL